MAGHSKWAQIKRKKAVTDARRGQAFTKFIREITVAAREGGGEPEFNPRLRLAIDTAKAANMPQENIERAIKRGTGELEGVSYEEVVYEAYGPGGVAIYIQAMTDNQNRTVAALRHLLDRNGGNLGTSGSVAWQFAQKGRIRVNASLHGEEELLEAALDTGAEDVTREGEEFVITTSADSIHRVREDLEKSGITPSGAGLTMIAKNEVPVAGKEAGKLVKLLDLLEESDDVQRVSSNAGIDEAVLAEVL